MDFFGSVKVLLHVLDLMVSDDVLNCNRGRNMGGGACVEDAVLQLWG